MEIFDDEYYSPAFDNWWLDDWITHVYGANRTTTISEWVVKHHTHYHGQRYEVIRKEHLLEGELAKGQKRVAAWLAGNRTN